MSQKPQGDVYTGKYFYTGQEWDTWTRLYYYGARYYFNEIGKFYSVDPAGFWPEYQQRILGNPQGWNSYAYVMNNPVKYVDPTGEWIQIPVIIFGVLSMFFLEDIPVANAPAPGQETVAADETQNIAEVAISEYNELSETEKTAIGLGFIIIGGVKELPKKGFKRFFHGTTEEFAENIVREGFEEVSPGKFTWLTDNLADEALGHAQKRSVPGSIIQFDLPEDKIQELIDKGYVEVNINLQGVTNYGFTNDALDDINEFVKKNAGLLKVESVDP